MAKKNSSKTATEKALQSAEPRVMSYGDWKGVNFVDSPLTWQPLEEPPYYKYNHNQTDLPKNYLMVQNNLVTTDTLSVETRYDSKVLGKLKINNSATPSATYNDGRDISDQWVTTGYPAGSVLTGISYLFHKWLFVVVRIPVKIQVGEIQSGVPSQAEYNENKTRTVIERILYRDITDTDPTHLDKWTEIKLKLNLVSKYPFTRNNTSYNMTKANTIPYGWRVTEMIAYEDNLVVTGTNMQVSLRDEQDVTSSYRQATIFLAKLNYNRQSNRINIKCDDYHSTKVNNAWTRDKVSNTVVSCPSVSTPGSAPVLTTVGMSSGPIASEGEINVDTGVISNDHVVKVEVCYCYTTIFGSTLPSPTASIFVQYQPTLWSSGRYVKVCAPNTNTKWYNKSGAETSTQSEVTKIAIDGDPAYDPRIYAAAGITGIDFYGRDTENIDWVFIGHITIPWSTMDSIPYGSDGARGTKWQYGWLGNMTDISQWTNSQLNIPKENNTSGPSASHVAVHDSRLYYWGDPNIPYRLYIGGSPGNEFSVARGLGGAWVDIEPGSGYQIMGTAKWKTNGGANIVTMMCGNANTTKVKRFNLVETNITITNEISYKGYMYEEVSNVVGCNSRYGYGVFGDGLYSINRYGLYLTTMAMEYNNQMKNQSVSEVIKPIFSERLGDRLKDARMTFIDDVIYIAFSAEGSDGADIINLDNVILCYDTVNQAWYTFTCDVTTTASAIGGDTDKVHHIFAVDSDEYTEGLGIITDKDVLLYPTTGTQKTIPPDFKIILETGEMMPKEPKQILHYVQQIELRFDYFISDPGAVTVYIEGVDYYGRTFLIKKNLNKTSRGMHGKGVIDPNDEDIEYYEMRDYVEWIRIDKYVESIRMKIIGKGRFRLTHWNMKWYAQADTYNTQWGFDAEDRYKDQHHYDSSGSQDSVPIHHYINDYNNLRRAVIS